MLLAVTTDDLGFMWVAVEGTTLASVFLVNFERTRASLEASYKYVLICSVGIAVAFLGTVLVYFADVAQASAAPSTRCGGRRSPRLAPGLPPRIVEMAFVFLLVGYGTKAGLAPMHTWLPDAHSEAPAPVSAMMSGVLLAVGVYAILRFKPIVDVAAGPAVARRLLVALGLALDGGGGRLSLEPAATTSACWRYSSVEHLGLVSLGLGFGGPWGVAGAHLAHWPTTRSRSPCSSSSRGGSAPRTARMEIEAVRGLLARLPVSGPLFFAAMLALLGLPPFGLFVSEVMIVGAGFAAGTDGGRGRGAGAAPAHRLRRPPPRAPAACCTGRRADREPERSAWAALPMVAALALLVMTRPRVAARPGRRARQHRGGDRSHDRGAPSSGRSPA